MVKRLFSFKVLKFRDFCYCFNFREMWHFKASYLLNKISFLIFFFTFDSIAKWSFKNTKPVLPIKKINFCDQSCDVIFPQKTVMIKKVKRAIPTPPFSLRPCPLPLSTPAVQARPLFMFLLPRVIYISHEKYFSDILDRKESFLDYKNTFEKKLENWSFHNFGQKNEISS